MNVNPQDYDRDERKAATWWSSRHTAGNRDLSSLKRIRKLTLIDLLLLLVMAGVLIPWVVQMDRRIDAGPYKVDLKEHRRDESLVLILKITLSGSAEVSDGNHLVGWKILDEDGLIVHQEYDLPPLPGNFREFLYMADSEARYICELSAGTEILSIQIPGE